MPQYTPEERQGLDILSMKVGLPEWTPFSAVERNQEWALGKKVNAVDIFANCIWQAELWNSFANLYGRRGVVRCFEVFVGCYNRLDDVLRSIFLEILEDGREFCCETHIGRRGMNGS